MVRAGTARRPITPRPRRWSSAELPLAPGAHRGGPGVDGVRGDEPVPAAPARLAAAPVHVQPELITPRLARPGPVIPERRPLGLDRPLEDGDDRTVQGADPRLRERTRGEGGVGTAPEER